MLEKELEKLRWSKEFEKKWIGKKIGTTLVPGHFSIKEYEDGFVIKPYMQNAIVLSKENTKNLWMHLDRHFTAEEVAKKV